MIGDTHSDGTVVWKEDFLMGLGKLPLVVGYNHRETFTSSGTFVAPITGLYRITLQGGGGGGGDSGDSSYGSRGGGGGGQGGHGEFYEKLIAGESYSYTIGAGGNTSSTGGTSSITLNGNEYTAVGGGPGISSNGTQYASAGGGGLFKINDVNVSKGASGTAGNPIISNAYGLGGTGGGQGGSISPFGGNGYDALFGGGGAGGTWRSSGIHYTAGKGGNGYIIFEWFDPADVWPNLFPAA